MSERERRISEARRGRNEIENHIVDAYVAGRIGRREFIRRGTVAGMSLPLLGMLIAACGGSDSNSSSSAESSAAAPATSAAAPASSAAAPASSEAAPSSSEAAPASSAAGASGGTVRVAVLKPGTEVDPVLAGDLGALAMIAFTGEFLIVDDGKQLNPWLADSWESNADASEWTFKLKSGVMFNDGTPMKAADVVATFDRLADPANKSNALSALKGVLSKGGTTATDDTTVVFKLDSPNGGFPFIASSDNYNAIILPAAYAGDFTKTFPGTGPWKMDSYTEGASATFSRNDAYWGAKALPDKLEITLAPDEAAEVLALQGGQVDIVQQVTVTGSQAILNDPKYEFIEILNSSNHRQLSMRNDMKPFDSPQVRQAIALTLDRDAIVQGLFDGKSDLGNDSPFAPCFVQTDTSIAQRKQDLDQAKSLLSQAGLADGFSTELVAIKQQEVPDYAQIVVESAKQIGVDIKLTVQESGPYYGDAVFGKSPWLDSIMSLVDYGHRGIPNVFLNAPLVSDGTWNAAHFKNPDYDALVKSYVAAVDLDSQKAQAGKIQQLLLDQTPIIFAYFYYYLIAHTAGLQGVRGTAIGQIWPDQVSVA